MPAPAQPTLEPGRVYRTRDFTPWGANAPRLARRLVEQGELIPLAHGLFAHPEQSRFGTVPPTDHEVMRAFLGDDDFVFTGPEYWNALGLGSTAVFAMPLVYNRKRSGMFEFGGRRFFLRRVDFPSKPTPEWFALDLLENAGQAGVSRDEVCERLTDGLDRGLLNPLRLQEMASRFGSKRTQAELTPVLALAA